MRNHSAPCFGGDASAMQCVCEHHWHLSLGKHATQLFFLKRSATRVVLASGRSRVGRIELWGRRNKEKPSEQAKGEVDGGGSEIPKKGRNKKWSRPGIRTLKHIPCDGRLGEAGEGGGCVRCVAVTWLADQSFHNAICGYESGHSGDDEMTTDRGEGSYEEQ